MDIQRTITVILPHNPDLKATLDAFQCVQQTLSPVCYNDGTPLNALALHRAMYDQVKGTLNSQLTCTAIRLVAGAYVSAKKNKKPAQRPFQFRNKAALFLIGKRGRDAAFRADGTLSIWTVAGRKRISYTVPDHFKPLLEAAKEINSMTVIERNGKLIGRVSITLDVPEPAGIHPVGIDRGETNIMVAVCADDEITFVSGLRYKVANRRTTRSVSDCRRNWLPVRQRARIRAVSDVLSNGLAASTTIAPARSFKPQPKS
jgi:putative transposase